MTTTPVDELAVRLALIRACNEAGGQKPFAIANGVTIQHVSAVVLGVRSPNEKLAAVLGFAKVTRYVPMPPVSESPRAKEAVMS